MTTNTLGVSGKRRALGTLGVLGLAIACTATTAAAQPASFTTYGPTCPRNPILINAVGVPRIGSTFQIDTFFSSRFNSTTLHFGISDQSLGGLRLPFDTSVWSVGRFSFCGFVLNSSEVVLQTPFQRNPGRVLVPFTVPNAPSLAGTVFFVQFVNVAFPDLVLITPLDFSDGLRGVIGF